MGDYEEDHLVSLGLGGAPYDPRNRWPEPRVSADGWNADLKDELEAVLARSVCSHRVPPAEAQQAIARDWIVAYIIPITSRGNEDGHHATRAAKVATSPGRSRLT
jgi:hypothetical protein